MKKQFCNLTKQDVLTLNERSLANTLGIVFKPSEADIEEAKAHLATLFGCRVYRPYALKIMYLNKIY